jgi:hypothetical protein
MHILLIVIYRELSYLSIGVVLKYVFTKKSSQIKIQEIVDIWTKLHFWVTQDPNKRFHVND